MVQLTGMAVTLTTDGDDDSDTDDHLYIGIIGSGGGREFPLDSEKEDFNQGQTEKFQLGLIWQGGFTDGSTKYPKQSEPGKGNDPARIPLDLDRVNFVYLRKQGDNTTDGDDAYQLQELSVVLYGPASPSMRSFRFNGQNKSLWLANENGHVVYLEEIEG